jgi:hypothetical protein
MASLFLAGVIFLAVWALEVIVFLVGYQMSKSSS